MKLIKRIVHRGPVGSPASGNAAPTASSTPASTSSTASQRHSTAVVQITTEAAKVNTAAGRPMAAMAAALEDRGGVTDQDRCQPPDQHQAGGDLRPALGGSEQASKADDKGKEQQQEGQAGKIVADQEPGAVVAEELADLGQGCVVGGRLALQDDRAHREQHEPSKTKHARQAPPRPGNGARP